MDPAEVAQQQVLACKTWAPKSSKKPSAIGVLDQFRIDAEEKAHTLADFLEPGDEEAAAETLARLADAEAALAGLRGAIQGAREFLSGARIKGKPPSDAQRYVDDVQAAYVTLDTQLVKLKVSAESSVQSVHAHRRPDHVKRMSASTPLLNAPPSPTLSDQFIPAPRPKSFWNKLCPCLDSQPQVRHSQIQQEPRGSFQGI
eukprot:c13262_g1_i2.p1 GENE.c13262_g1_i2~~c13262_g1_i2.p1  ORF type:complete len:210 (+),score=43.48 c13262_g1_i2:30-632(+)